MYNHYIPQSDGSYRRSTVSDGNRRGNPQRPSHPQQNPSPPPKPPEQSPVPCAPQHTPEPRRSSNDGILSFFKGLLPQDIDTADLLVILLILLMNKDEKEDSFSPLLTLALYFLL